MPNWRDLELFKGIALEDSWVIAWQHSEKSFSIELEVSLWPSHPDYETPNSGHYTCYKRGQLIFPKPRNLSGFLSMEQAKKHSIQKVLLITEILTALNSWMADV